MLSLVKISDIFNIEKGSLQSSKNIPGEYDFVTAGAEWKTHNAYSHDCEALIFAMAASGSLGRTHYVNGKFITSDLCFILTPKAGYESKLDLMFYYYYFNSIRAKLVKETATGTSKLSINQTNFSNYNIIFGDLDEQEKLRRVYEGVDKYSAELLLKIAKQEKYASLLRQRIFQMAVEGKLVPQDNNDEPACTLLQYIRAEKETLVKEHKIKSEKTFPLISNDEVPFELPNGWEWCRINNVVLKSEAGKSLNCIERPVTNDEWGIIKVSAVSWGNFLENENKFYSLEKPEDTSAKIKAGDFLITRANTEELVGKSVVVDTCTKNLLLSDKTIRFVFSKYINKRFVNINNNCAHIRNYYISKASGTSKSMKNITREQMLNALLPLPPFAEQQRIVEKVDLLMELCVRLEESISTAKKHIKQLLQSVLNQAFSSKFSSTTKIQPFPDNYMEDWDIAAKADGDIKPETQSKIAARLAELSKAVK